MVILRVIRREEKSDGGGERRGKGGGGNFSSERGLRSLTCDCDPGLSDPPSGRTRPERASRASARANSDSGVGASSPSAKTGRDHWKNLQPLVY